jgi:hypothetical protein
MNEDQSSAVDPQIWSDKHQKVNCAVRGPARVRAVSLWRAEQEAVQDGGIDCRGGCLGTDAEASDWGHDCGD